VSTKGEYLSRAVVQAILLWCWDEEIPVSWPITEEWLQKFAGRWVVARNVYKGKLGQAARVLNGNLRKVKKGQEGPTVQQTADELKRRGIAPVKPVSLVSKVAYFLKPERFALTDRYARAGLERLRREAGIRGKLALDYVAYLQAFNEQFKRLETDIKAECNRPWARELVKRLGYAPEEVLKRRGFRRKVLDNFLLIKGGGLPRRTKPKRVTAGG